MQGIRDGHARRPLRLQVTFRPTTEGFALNKKNRERRLNARVDCGLPRNRTDESQRKYDLPEPCHPE